MCQSISEVEYGKNKWTPERILSQKGQRGQGWKRLTQCQRWHYQSIRRLHRSSVKEVSKRFQEERAEIKEAVMSIERKDMLPPRNERMQFWRKRNVYGHDLNRGQSFTHSRGESVIPLLIQAVSQPHTLSFKQKISHSSSKSFSHSFRQWVSHSLNQTVSKSVSKSITPTNPQSVSVGLSASHPIRYTVNRSLNNGQI